MNTRSFVRIGVLATSLLAGAHAQAREGNPVEGYGFESAAQEITQLIWLAETATACRWASAEEATRFKLFSVRFLSAHLNDSQRLALVSMVTDARYEAQLHDAALEGSRVNCASNRWQIGWRAFKAAADENDSRY